MDESQNNTNNNDLNLVPPEENPLQEAPKADDQSGAIGDALNPNNFSSDSDPLLSGATSSVRSWLLYFCPPAGHWYAVLTDSGGHSLCA